MSSRCKIAVVGYVNVLLSSYAGPMDGCRRVFPTAAPMSHARMPRLRKLGSMRRFAKVCLSTG